MISDELYHKGALFLLGDLNFNDNGKLLEHNPAHSVLPFAPFAGRQAHLRRATTAEIIWDCVGIFFRVALCIIGVLLLT